MSNTANSFRLQRLTKTVGVRDQSFSEYAPKETLKLAALNSINRSIKYNDLSFASGRTDLNKLRKEPETGDDLEYQSAHHNLDSVRKNFDSTHKEKVKRQNSINKLKDEKTKLSIIEGELLDNRNRGKEKVKSLEEEREHIKLMLREADTQKKVLLNMRARLKSDKVVYDQRKFNMEKELRFLKTQLDVFKKDGSEICESDDRTNKVYRKYLRELNAEKEERENHLNSIEAMIEEKRKVNQINEFREREIMEIAERAMQDKDPNEKNWEKLYLTNKFLARMLREKMDKEMNKFFVVESAFKNIKIATGVNDAETLVNKFLTKESAYGDLLGKIAENEKRIESLKLETEELLQEHKDLEAEKEVFDHTKKVIPKIEKETKELNEVNSNLKNANLHKEKLRNWIMRSVKKINLVLGTNHSASVGRDEKSIQECFDAYLTILEAELKNAEVQEEKTDKFNEEEKMRNEKKANRISSQPFQEESEEENAEHEQNDLISGARHEVHRQNQKFMKELKKKREETKKAKLDSNAPKVKEKVPEKPKVEEVQ